MIAITGLRKSYGGKTVLDGLNMTVPTGAVYGFLGENGAGKSTTMNIITGLLAKDGGEIQVDGKGFDPDEPFSIGYLPESPEFFEYMTCRQYFAYIAAACKFQGDMGKRTEEVIRLVGLERDMDRKIKGFSRGMRQRIGIGCAMYSGKDILLLDEPTSALDPQGRADIMNIIQNLKEMGKTIVLSTHILSDVERVADSVGILHEGRLQVEGKISDLLKGDSNKMIGFQAEGFVPEYLEELREKPFAAAAEFSGNTGYVTIAGEDFSEGNRALFRFLADKGCVVSNYQVSHPSLEQIYLKVVGRHDTAAGWH